MVQVGDVDSIILYNLQMDGKQAKLGTSNISSPRNRLHLCRF